MWLSVERIVCTISHLFSLGRVFRIVVCFDFVCLVCLVGRGLHVVCCVHTVQYPGGWVVPGNQMLPLPTIIIIIIIIIIIVVVIIDIIIFQHKPVQMLLHCGYYDRLICLILGLVGILIRG